jgi:hypothetical protein
MAKIISVSFILFLIVVVTIMNGYKVEAQGRSMPEQCVEARENCLRDGSGFWCIMYCHNCPFPAPVDPICFG